MSTSAFDYLSVMHSIVLALGIARLLGGLAAIVHHWREIKPTAFYIGWMILLLSLHMGWWFGLWARFHTAADIPLSTYVVWFAVPAALYVASRLLVPEFAERATLPDLSRRFWEIRVPFFVCLLIPMTLEIPGLIAGTAPLNRWFLVTLGLLALSGAVFRHHHWHRVLLGLMAADYVAFMVLARSSLGVAR